MSLLRIFEEKLNPLSNKEDRDYFEICWNEFDGMCAFSPIYTFLTPGQGMWIPLINFFIATDAKFPSRVYHVFERPSRVVDKH